MFRRRLAFPVFIVSLILILPGLFTLATNEVSSQTLLLGPSQPYSEHLSLYLTSGETYWRADLLGGNISFGSFTVPPSISGFSVTLTHYDLWNPQFEIFAKYGLGLLGPYEPNPNGTILVVNTTSANDAQVLANSLSQRFALSYQPYNSTPNGFVFFSPIDFNTEVHVFFWRLLPAYYRGFASMLSEDQFESNDLAYYRLSFSANTNSVSIGGLRPFSQVTPNEFALYDQLGLVQTPINYSPNSTSSKIEVHVLGGLVSNSTYPYINHFSNLSASIYEARNSSAVNSTVPDINATLNLSFPTILAYRSVSSLTPKHNDNVSVTITVKNISPEGSSAASNVHVNDTWPYSHSSDFNLTVGKTGEVGNLSAGGGLMTEAYAFSVLANNGTFSIPATPVTYQFTTANKTITASAFLNPETLIVGASNTPELEAIESVSTGSIQVGQALTVNVSAFNKGNGIAFNLKSGSQSLASLLPGGQPWSFNESSTPGSIVVANSSISYPFSWEDSSSLKHDSTTNTMSAIYSFSTPGTPAVSLLKNIFLPKDKKQANVTLILSDNSVNPVSNLTMTDSLPNGFIYWKTTNSSSVRESNGIVHGNLTLLKPHEEESLVYTVNITEPSQNFVILPASASSVWNNVMITHYSKGIGLPLGIVGSKQINPNQAFQGSNVTITIGLVNDGSLPIYDVNLSNTNDAFLNVLSSTTNYRTILSSGGIINATLNANLTGTPGIYNSSSASASFIFAGANQSASSNTFRVKIYHVLEGNLSYYAPKTEENHPITVKVLIVNPSNVTVTNIQYAMGLPSGLRITQGGTDNFTIASLGPNQNVTESFQFTTGQPYAYTINPGTLIFVYQGHTLKGLTTGFVVNILDDLRIRYLIPILIGILILLGTVFSARRLSKKS